MTEALRELNRNIMVLSQRLALGWNGNRNINYRDAARRVKAFRDEFLETLEPNLRKDLKGSFDSPFDPLTPLATTTLEHARLNENRADRSKISGDAILGYYDMELNGHGRTGTRRVGWYPKSELRGPWIKEVDESSLPPSLQVKDVLNGPCKRMSPEEFAAFLHSRQLR
jgi:hypothetical protein